MHQWIRSAGWADLQASLWVLWDPGWWGMGIRGSLWRSSWIIHAPPHLRTPPTHPPCCLPASIPLCSTSTETCTTVWMNDLCLSPSLNLKWGAFCWVQLLDTAITISPKTLQLPKLDWNRSRTFHTTKKKNAQRLFRLPYFVGRAASVRSFQTFKWKDNKKHHQGSQYFVQ